MDPLQPLLINLIRTARQARLSPRDFDRIVRRQYIIETLAEFDLNVCRTARELGLHRNTLTRQLRELDINIAVMRRDLRRNKIAFKKSVTSEKYSVAAALRA